MIDSAERARIESWFVSRGLPHYIENYSARRDIFTRALPLLTIVFVFEVLTALNLDWAWWANLLGIMGACAVLTGCLATSNRMRHRRLLQRPNSVGIVEILFFVLVPPIVPLIFGGKGTVSLATISTNLLLLGIIYLFTSYGVIPTTRWAVVKLWSQLGALVRLLTRALPLLLLFVTFLFINPDTWQVTSDLYGIYFTSTMILFAVIGTAFVIARLPQEIGDLNNFHDAEQVNDEIATTGLAVRVSATDDTTQPAELSRRQWGNTGLVVLVSQGIQVLLVAVIVEIFLVILGLLTIRPTTLSNWLTGIHSHPHELLHLKYGHEELVLTEELLRVSVFLAAFSALYFTVVALTDATYREEFFRDVVTEVRQALAVRKAYLQHIDR